MSACESVTLHFATFVVVPTFTKEDLADDHGFPSLFKVHFDRDVYGRNVEMVPGGFLENISFCIFYSPSSHMVSGR